MEQILDYFNNKRILITGGGGYLGSKLAEKLKDSGASLSLLDLKFNELSSALAKQNSNVCLYEIDMTNKKSLKEACTKIKPDYIFHFAALLNRERNFDIYPTLYNVNVNGTYNLLDSLKDIPYQGLYFSSSSEVYCAKNKSPFREDQTPDPVSPYSLSKVMAEQLIQTYSGLNDKPFTIFRLFNFYGSGMPANFFINQLIDCLKSDKVFEMTGGKQIRDFIHIDDLLHTILSISKSDKSTGQIYNICSGTGIKLSDLATLVAKRLGKEQLLKIGVLAYRDNEVWKMIGANKKAKSLLQDYTFPNVHDIITRII